MKFSSFNYPPYSKQNNKNNNSSSDYTSKVKIPNYTTPVYTKSQTTNHSHVSNDIPTKSTYDPRNPNLLKRPSKPLPINRPAPVMPTSNQFSPRPNSYINHTGNNIPANTDNIYYTSNSNYNGPVGVPLMPLYGYDNYEDAEKDLGYFRQLHPNTAKRIMNEIDDECDKLEYEGSAMFDEYPDKVRLGRIIDRIYEKMKDEIEEPIIYSKSIESNHNYEEINSIDIETLEIENEPTNAEDINKDKTENTDNLKVLQYRKDKGRDSISNPRRDNNARANQKPPVRSNNWLRDLIEILLYQEFQNRRRRYRSRCRWF